MGLDPIFAQILGNIAPEGSVYRGTAQELRESLGFNARKLHPSEFSEAEQADAYERYAENEENLATGN